MQSKPIYTIDTKGRTFPSGPGPDLSNHGKTSGDKIYINIKPIPATLCGIDFTIP